MGLIHLISALVSFFRWLDRQQREAAIRSGQAPRPPAHSPGEAARVQQPPAAPRPALVVAHSRTAPHLASPHRQPTLIDDAPNGPIEWLLRRFEGGKR